MQYLGGKSRLSKPISEIINQYSKNKTFVSLFCGSCAIESKVESKSKILNDSHRYLISMFRAIQDGYQIPENISKDEYERIKNNKDENEALTGFVGFACSFGGKWFGGYAHLKNYTEKNYAAYSRNSLLKKMKGLDNAIFICKDYKDVYIHQDSVVYCDPPYIGTTSYSNSKKFNHDEFWDYMRKISEQNTVFISEYTAPDDFVSIWEKVQTTKLDARKKSNIFTSIDKLFVHKRKVL